MFPNLHVVGFRRDGKADFEKISKETNLFKQFFLQQNKNDFRRKVKQLMVKAPKRAKNAGPNQTGNAKEKFASPQSEQCTINICKYVKIMKKQLILESRKRKFQECCFDKLVGNDIFL